MTLLILNVLSYIRPTYLAIVCFDRTSGTEVYVGLLTDGREAAIKRVPVYHAERENEADLLVQLSHTNIVSFMVILYTVEPRYNAVDGVHNFGPRCKRGALGVLISATREQLNNSDRCPLHQVHEPCRSPVCLQHSLIRQYAVYGT